MAIYLYCYGCRASFGIDLKKCPKCGAAIDPKKRCFRIQVMVNRKLIVKLVPGNITLAREVETKIKTRLIEGVYKDPRQTEPKLSEVWGEYLKGYKARGKAWRREELRYNKTLGPKFGDKTLKAISPFHVEKYIIELKSTMTRFNRPYGSKAINNIIDLLSVIFNYAKRLGMFAGDNPCRQVSKPKVNNEVLNILPVEKIQELLTYLETYPDRTMAALIVFLTFTGCRLGEAFKLDYSDINFEDRIVRLRDPKGGKDQFIYLNDGALRAINEQKQSKKTKCDIVFPSVEGARRNKIGRRWLLIKEAIGIPTSFRCHDLRHQFASMLASSGEVDQYTLQRLLTHKDFKTTQRYAHLFPHTIRNGATMVDKILAEKSDPKIIKLA